MGKQSPVTLKRVTLNYLNDHTKSEKEGDEMELQRFLNGPEARKDHLLKTFFTCLSKHRHIHMHAPLPASVFTLDTWGVEKETVCGQMAVGSSAPEDTF